MVAVPVTALQSCSEDRALQDICAAALEKVLWAVQLTHFFFKIKKHKTVQRREPNGSPLLQWQKLELVIFLGDWTGARVALSSQPVQLKLRGHYLNPSHLSAL